MELTSSSGTMGMPVRALGVEGGELTTDLPPSRMRNARLNQTGLSLPVGLDKIDIATAFALHLITIARTHAGVFV